LLHVLFICWRGSYRARDAGFENKPAAWVLPLADLRKSFRAAARLRYQLLLITGPPKHSIGAKKGVLLQTVSKTGGRSL